MTTRRAFLQSVAALALSAALPRPARAADLASLLEPLRREAGVPALGAALVRPDRIAAWAVTGVRRLGSPTGATVEDLWHLGSLTKSMTATLAGRLVEEGRIDWETRVGDLFPEVRTPVTLQMLLTHRSGLPRGIPGLLKRYPGAHQRDAHVREAFASARPPGGFEYSNHGYIVAGAMLERAAGATWESLMRERLFAPLGMRDAGFGPSPPDQPWGHAPRNGGLVPTRADNPPVLGPAGRVHCSLRDLATYAQAHLHRDRYLRPETFRHLHTPWPGGTYACGWGVGRDGALSHTGSNLKNVARIRLLPDQGVARIVVCNAGGAGDVCRQAMQRLAQAAG